MFLSRDYKNLLRGRREKVLEITTYVELDLTSKKNIQRLAIRLDLFERNILNIEIEILVFENILNTNKYYGTSRKVSRKANT